jgi:Ser/Thr protein kinase RdoA (MazF antagonist)
MSLNGAAADEPNHNDEPSLGSPTTSSSSLDVDNEEQARKLLKPAPTDEQILALLGTHYSQYSDVKIVRQLDSYDDVNYQVELDGTNYLLKIHNGVESLNYIATSGNNFYANMTSVIQLQTAILELCREHGLPVNEPIRPTPDSSSDATTIPNDKKCPVCVVKLPVVDHGRSCDLVVRLLSWLRGRPMSNVNLLPLESLADAGRFLGRLDKVLDHINEAALRGHTLAKVESNASLVLEQQGADSTASPKAKRARATCSSLDHLRADLGTLQEQATNTVLDVGLLIPANRFHQWDTKHTLQLRKFVTHIPNEKRQGLVTSVIDAFQTQLVDTGVAAQFRTGVIHGDFNDANTLVNEEMAVCGAIDFGDSVCRYVCVYVSAALTYGSSN